MLTPGLSVLAPIHSCFFQELQRLKLSLLDLGFWSPLPHCDLSQSKDLTKAFNLKPHSQK
jgi:hypothetical protein